MARAAIPDPTRARVPANAPRPGLRAAADVEARPLRVGGAMCLAIPGRIVSIIDADERLMEVEIAGVRRPVNVGLLAVNGACEILGIDPMYVANEGKLVAFVAPEAADAALAALRSVPGCEEAADVGEVRADPRGIVLLETAFGGRRVMDLLVGDPLPRIC